VSVTVPSTVPVCGGEDEHFGIGVIVDSVLGVGVDVGVIVGMGLYVGVLVYVRFRQVSRVGTAYQINFPADSTDSQRLGEKVKRIRSAKGAAATRTSRENPSLPALTFMTSADACHTCPCHPY